MSSAAKPVSSLRRLCAVTGSGTTWGKDRLGTRVQGLSWAACRVGDATELFRRFWPVADDFQPTRTNDLSNHWRSIASQNRADSFVQI